MAEYISFQPSDYFNTILYTGDGASSNAITGVGFQPDFLWIKQRSATRSHQLMDAVRGAGYRVMSNDTAAQSTSALTSFDSDGFTVDGSSLNGTNVSGGTFASWNWKAGTTSGLTGGTITPSSYSFNATAGISILKYTGNATAGATVPHGLGAVPKMIMVKNLDRVEDWFCYHSGIATDAETDYINLNLNGAAADHSGMWNDTAPTSSVFSLGNANPVNSSGEEIMAYCFADVKGYSKFGSYVGNNGGANGVFVYTGFRPSLVIQKASSAANGEWLMTDVKRNTYNLANTKLEADTTDAEFTDFGIDILSNGFKTKADGSDQQDSGVTYIYAAFAEFPLVSSNDIPGTAR